MKKSPAKLGLYVFTDRQDANYFHVYATVVNIGLTLHEMHRIDSGESFPEIGANTIRNAGSSGFGDDLHNGLYFDNLRVLSQGNTRDNPRCLYGFDIEYRDLYSVNARQARHMAHTLETITKRMEKIRARYGEPATFGQYLAHVADAIGADSFVKLVTGRQGAMYRDNQHRVLNRKEGIYYVDNLISDWVDEANKVVQ